jgi:hypothetical protein
MAIAQRFTKNAIITRLTDVLGYDDIETGKQEYREHIAIACSIPQPLSDSHSGDIQGGFGKEYIIFTPLADIQDNDLVTIEDKQYRIAGLERFEGFGANEHMELRLRIF